MEAAAEELRVDVAAEPPEKTFFNVRMGPFSAPRDFLPTPGFIDSSDTVLPAHEVSCSLIMIQCDGWTRSTPVLIYDSDPDDGEKSPQRLSHQKKDFVCGEMYRHVFSITGDDRLTGTSMIRYMMPLSQLQLSRHIISSCRETRVNHHLQY
jgi:hypothetical protein